MAGQGPLPGTGAKPEGQRRRRNKAEPKTELDAGATVPDAPELGDGYRDETKAWWAAWVKSPQATMFTGPAWTRLRMLARLIDDFHSAEASPSDRKQIFAEIRLQESLLLATPADQLRAKLDLRPKTDTGKPPPTAKSNAKRTTDRRERILKSVPDAAAG